MRSKLLNPRIYRVIALIIVAIIVFIVFSARLCYLQIYQYEQWSKISKSNHTNQRKLEVKRGVITDRNNIELAISIETYNVYLYRREVKDINEVAGTLSTLLPLTREEIIKKSKKSQYALLCKNVELNLANKIKQLNIKGINLESHFKRYYPQNSLAANIIGFCGEEQLGLEGMEKLYDNSLKGYPGIAIQEDISISGNKGAGVVKNIRPPMGGSNITLTIDTFIQHTIETELQALAKKYDPLDITGIVADPYTGEILGMACYPTFDLNNFSHSNAFNIKNRPATDMFEPGSCIKIIAAATGLENHKIDSGTRFYCKGYGELKGEHKRIMKCTGHHGLLDINEAVAKSCNAAMLQLSQLLENDMIYRMYKRFGLGEPTGIEVVSESNGILRPPSKWSPFSPSSLCIGQELTVTSLQLIQAYSAIANGGNLIRPRLIKSISSADGDYKQEFEPEIIRKVVSPQLARKLRSMLRGVVDEGGGSRATLDDYTSGGKTSTAQKPERKPDGTMGYSNTKLVTSFIGMAPAMEPRIVVFVALNEPKGDVKTMFGSRLAAPSFAVIANKVLNYLKVPPDKNVKTSTMGVNRLLEIANKSDTAENGAISSFTSKIESSETNNASLTNGLKVVPNLVGKSMKAAINTINSLGLKAIYEGDGIVVNQRPPAGKPFPASKILRIKLSSNITD